MDAYFYELKEYWNKLISSYTQDESLKTKLLDEIIGAYQKPERHYHTLKHVHSMITAKIPYKNDIEKYNALCFAIWYHDIIYQTYKTDNEKKSAKLANKNLKLLGLDKSFRIYVEKLILCTKHNDKNIVYNNFDFRLMIDLDLKILASNIEKYQEYTKQIREEYKVIPSFIYNRNRKRFLKTILSKKNIFQTHDFIKAYENMARKNLKNEINTLNLI